MKKRVLTNVFFIFICLALLFCLDVFPFKIRSAIQVELPAVMVGDTRSPSSASRIRIDGTLTSRLFRDREFSGSLAVEGYDFTAEDSGYALKATLCRDEQTELLSGSLTYTQLEGLDQLYLGQLYVSGTFEQVFIRLPGAGWILWAAPAETAQEAEDLATAYFPLAERPRAPH